MKVSDRLVRHLIRSAIMDLRSAYTLARESGDLERAETLQVILEELAEINGFGTEGSEHEEAA